MFSLEIECDPDDRELLIAELWEHGSAGIAELSSARVRAFFDESVGREHLQRMYPGSTLRIEEQRDWVQAARDLLQPTEVGQRFFLVPFWRDDPTPAGRFRIEVNPGMAFGTGAHETTRLCLEALERHVRAGMSLLDVGTGSGILAQAARLLGAGKVYACDVDPMAVEIAGTGFVGSVDGVAGESVELVVANINPEVIIALAPDLLRVLRPGGTLLVSGFELDEVAQVRRALPSNAEATEKGGWVMLSARK